MNGWESKYPSKTYNILNAIRGECFFWKEKYLESEPYFFSYVERERSLGRAPDATYLGEYASCLYMNHKNIRRLINISRYTSKKWPYLMMLK